MPKRPCLSNTLRLGVNRKTRLILALEDSIHLKLLLNGKKHLIKKCKIENQPQKS